MSDTKDNILFKTLISFTFFQCITWLCRHNKFAQIWPSAYQKLIPHDQDYWACSIVSTIHSIIVIPLAIYCVRTQRFFTINEDYTANNMFVTTSYSTVTLTIFGGYILSDLSWLLHEKNRWSQSSSGGNNLMIMHHIFGFLTAMDFCFNKVGHNVALVTLLMEGTTPFINLRWFLSKMGKKATPIYFVNGLLIVTTWFILRICGATFIGVMIFQMQPRLNEVPWFTRNISFRTSAVVSYVLQWVWFIKIVKGLLSFITSSKKN